MEPKARYQVIGFVVWHGGKWYLRRRYGDLPRKLALLTLLAAGIAGALAAQRRQSSLSGS